MKKIFILMCCFWCMFHLYAQQPQMIVITPPEDTVVVGPEVGFSNCDLNAAKTICGKYNGIKGHFNASAASCCLNGKIKLYYTFIPNRSVVLYTLGTNPDTAGSIHSSMLFGAFSSPGNVGAINSNYKLYGPFDINENYTDLITNGVAPVLASDATINGTHSIGASVLKNKVYVVEFTIFACSGYIDIQVPTPFIQYGPEFDDLQDLPQFLNCDSTKIDCDNCIPKFQPVDDRYVVSAWVKELEASTEGALNYENASLKVTSGGNVATFHPAGQIIDGWQRIEGIIQTNSLGNLKMELIMDDGIAYFDDIRVSPFDGSMITYVYDPITLRLMAEMDERNYAKIYEYDEEGKLVRVKKETEKGIMTIQENRENSSTND